MALRKDLALVAGLVGAMALAATVANTDRPDTRSKPAPAPAPVTVAPTPPKHPAIMPNDMPYSPHEHRDDLAAMLNLLREQHAPCIRHIDPSTARLADLVNPDPVNPEFLVRCDRGRTTVRFTWMDMMNQRLPSAAPAPDRIAAVSACEQAARSRATQPQTVSFSRVMGMEFRDNGDGSASIRTTFKAKNAFNLETKYLINCEYDGNQITTAFVSEHR